MDNVLSEERAHPVVNWLSKLTDLDVFNDVSKQGNILGSITMNEREEERI